MNIDNESFNPRMPSLKKKAYKRKTSLSVEELEKPYLKLVYFNPYQPLRKF